jgi:hypothetical protein
MDHLEHNHCDGQARPSGLPRRVPDKLGVVPLELSTLGEGENGVSFSSFPRSVVGHYK